MAVDHSPYLLSTLLILFLILSPPVSADPPEIVAAIIKSSCKQAPIPQACEELLLSNSSANIDPSDIKIKITGKAIAAIVKTILGFALKDSNVIFLALQAIPAIVDLAENRAVRQCGHLIALTIKNLKHQQAVAHLGDVGSLRLWASSARSYVQACEDGFKQSGAQNNPLDKLPMADLVKVVFKLVNLLGGLKHRPHAGSGRFRASEEQAAAALPPNRSSSDSREYSYWVPAQAKPGDRKLVAPGPPAGGRTLVVSKKGGANKYGTVNASLAAAAGMRKNGYAERITILVEGGEYEENLEVLDPLNDVSIVGDGMGLSVITGRRSQKDKFPIAGTATLAVCTDGVTLEGLTIRNTARVENGPGVALLLAGDRAVVYNCSIEGSYTTIFSLAMRHFIKRCHIFGSEDIVYGDGAAVFQDCAIYVQDSPKTGRAIAAQTRQSKDEPTGFSFITSSVHVSPTGQKAGRTIKPESLVLLGRQAGPGSTVVYMESFLGSVVGSVGWTTSGPNADLYFGEYRNTGPGASTESRARFPGYVANMSAADAGYYTPGGDLISGHQWLPSRGLPLHYDV